MSFKLSLSTLLFSLKYRKHKSLKYWALLSVVFAITGSIERRECTVLGLYSMMVAQWRHFSFGMKDDCCRYFIQAREHQEKGSDQEWGNLRWDTHWCNQWIICASLEPQKEQEVDYRLQQQASLFFLNVLPEIKPKDTHPLSYTLSPFYFFILRQSLAKLFRMTKNLWSCLSSWISRITDVHNYDWLVSLTFVGQLTAFCHSGTRSASLLDPISCPASSCYMNISTRLLASGSVLWTGATVGQWV